ncbi:hypothetical protein HMPREF9625_01147 [Oribacterium parvum ACB1]|uniref:Uncharacterized protein n=1 Tax=Oribacterium parvum ACB1 TaxID=796943 RepID=G9WP64_9FIRM|nr:hypothetical protein [Oribacterium parvum]EHL10147.1 hypothetical protein HMPREF9625_01147 [Oribacterium parvum ACB1]EJF14139.1 hypothetical protein HMPREF1145_1663 [Oribacterium parvum ACB8]
MKKISKSMKICIALGILFGLILLFIKLRFQLSEEETMRIYIYSSIAVLLTGVIINLSYNLFYGRKINVLTPLLAEAKYDEYLEKITAIRDKVKSKHLRAIAELNRTAALTGKKEYRAAVEILKELAPRVKKMSSVEMVRRLNLCLNYFYLKEYKEAETLYKDSESLFRKYKENAFYKKNFTILDLFMDLCCYGKKEGVAEGIQEARRMYPEKQLQEDFDYLEALLKEGK